MVARAGGPPVVAIGGGTGLGVALRGLKQRVSSGQLTAVVTVTDDGGSSGRLRKDFGVLPPGDIRNCIVALADDEDLLARLFQYRFANGGGLAGHSFGNLLLTALTGITGEFYQAISTAESILSVRGRILPATLTDVRLRGLGHSGNIYEGESAIGTSGEPMKALRLEPEAPAAFPAAVEAIEEAAVIVLGPGSLYTSILPNLLIPGIRAAVQRSAGKVILPLNLMTQPGETDGMDGRAHLAALERLAAEDLVDAVIVNSAAPDPALLQHYEETGSIPVTVELDALRDRGIEVLATDLLAEGELIRHDPLKLAEAVLSFSK